LSIVSDLSRKLSEQVITLHTAIDDQKNARYVTFYYNEKLQQGFELENQKCWKSFFACLFKAREKIVKIKTEILEPLMSQLSTFDMSVKSPWKQCLESLKSCIKLQSVILFGRDMDQDVQLHAIKNQFCLFANDRMKKKLGLQIQSDQANNLIGLSTKEMAIFNLYAYAEMPAMSDETKIQSKIKRLRNHPKIEGETVLIKCKRQGLARCNEVKQAWTDCCETLRTHFEYDISSIGFHTKGSISFKCIWNKYAKLAGPLHQALEKTKFAYEQVMREQSRGGFMFR